MLVLRVLLVTTLPPVMRTLAFCALLDPTAVIPQSVFCVQSTPTPPQMAPLRVRSVVLVSLMLEMETQSQTAVTMLRTTLLSPF